MVNRREFLTIFSAAAGVIATAPQALLAPVEPVAGVAAAVKDWPVVDLTGRLIEMSYRPIVEVIDLADDFGSYANQFNFNVVAKQRLSVRIVVKGIFLPDMVEIKKYRCTWPWRDQVMTVQFDGFVTAYETHDRGGADPNVDRLSTDIDIEVVVDPCKDHLVQHISS
jgi:hypothetical protein